MQRCGVSAVVDFTLNEHSMTIERLWNNGLIMGSAWNFSPISDVPGHWNHNPSHIVVTIHNHNFR